MFIRISLKGTFRTNFRRSKHFLSDFWGSFCAPPYKPPGRASRPAGWCRLPSSASRRPPQMLAPIDLWLKRQKQLVWAVQRGGQEVKAMTSGFTCCSGVWCSIIHKQPSSASYNHTVCVTGFLKERNLLLPPRCSSSCVYRWMRPATPRWSQSEMWVSIPPPPLSCPCTDYSRTCAVLLHPLRSHLNSGHSHLFPLFLQWLSILLSMTIWAMSNMVILLIKLL